MPPQRIVSLVPSLTELVFSFGLGDRLVGRTRFCESPADGVERVPILGGTKNPVIDRIVAANPDLVIANKEENRREDIEALRAAGLEVLLTDPNTVDEALQMIGDLGGLLGVPRRAGELISATRTELAQPLPANRPRVFVAIWHEPLMGLGCEAYGHDLLERCGAVNVLRDRPRYPVISLEEVAASKPDLILLPDEPYPFREQHLPAYAALAPARVIDGKWLWWYGSRMPQAVRELRLLLNGGRQ